MTDLQIEQVAIADLSPWAKNARTHSRKQIRQIATSIETFGFTSPILIDASNTILAGHGRARAAEQLGMTRVPCVRLEHMTPAQKRAYVLADNRLALNAGWDEHLLAEELGALLEIDSGFDIEVTGFSVAEIDSLIEGQDVQEPGDPRDDVLPQGQLPRRCRRGDVWQLGPHRLVCGDALDPGTIGLVMKGEHARMVFTDPPYNLRVNGHVSGKGRVKHAEFAMASGEMSPDEFTRFLRDAFRNMTTHSLEGSIHFICMDWRHARELLAASDGLYSELKNMIVWVKNNGGMGTFYRSRHELIFAFKVGTGEHINSFALGQNGRYRTNVWEYQGVNTFRSGRMDDLEIHPTAKPVQLVADAIKDVSRRGEIVLDPFAGAGATLIAAEKTGRRARLVELDPGYCDRILARWEAWAKDDAEQLVCGLDRQAPAEVDAE